MKREISILNGGALVELNDFAKSIVMNTLLGMLRSLHDVDADQEIRITISAAKGGADMKRVFPIALAAIAVLASTAAAAPQITLTIFGAGTLAAPFRQIDEELSRMYPNLAIQAQFGGSVKMVKQVTELHQVADVVAVADYNVIPKYLFGADGSPAYTTWYAGFATNAITFVYTGRSRFTGEITPQNWYQVLARPGVQIGRSNPDTDPSGYQTVQMLALAEKHYNAPGLAAAILSNAPRTNMRDTETELIAALQSGQIDYLAIYLSDARQHGFSYVSLPPQIDLSDARYTGSYAEASVQTVNGTLAGQAHRVRGDDTRQRPASAVGSHIRAVPAWRKGTEGNGKQRLWKAFSRLRQRPGQGPDRIEIAPRSMAPAVTRMAAAARDEKR